MEKTKKCGDCVFFQNISNEFSLEELVLLKFEVGVCYLKCIFSNFYEKYITDISFTCDYFIDKNDEILKGTPFYKGNKKDENNLFGRFTL